MAMVIAFDPDPEFTCLVASLAAQFDVVVIVDNGDAARTGELLGPLRNELRVVHLANGGNLGVGTALNRALAYARDHRYPWMVTFDHDSRVRGDYRAILFNDMHGACAPFSRTAVIGPVWRRLGGAIDFADYLDRSQHRYADVPSVITSGSCVNVEVAWGIGGFDEALFVDSIDQEFCLRARYRGYRVVVDRALSMEHRLGAEREMHFFGRRFTVTDHSPIRRYYIARNKIQLWRNFLFRYPIWVLTDMKWYVIETIKVFLFEGDRPRKLIAFLLGHLHGLFGVKRGIPASAARLLR